MTQSQAAPDTLYEATGRDDIVLPFQIDPFGVRGRLIRLGTVAETVIGRHGYPDAVGAMLGETMALAACLAGSLKYEGVFTLQTTSDGPIKTLMADITSGGAIRAYANFKADAVADLTPADVTARSVPRLMGGGYIAFTVDQGDDTDRYQGIVELEGHTLSECTHAYFRNSEQLDAGILLACQKGKDGWRAGALMLQRLPYQRDLPGNPTEEDYDDGWHTAMTLLSSGTAVELLDQDLSPDRLLYRLFHGEGVRAYPAQAVSATCRCSSGRVERVLKSLSDAELQDLKQDDPDVSVICEFCKTVYRYDEDQLAELRAAD